MNYSYHYGQTAAYNTQSQNYQQYPTGVQSEQFAYEYMQQNGYYLYPLANYNMCSNNYQQPLNNLQWLQPAPPHMQRVNRDNRALKPVTKKPLDHTLILNGVIIWAYEPTTDKLGLPAKPFVCCRTSGGHFCTQRELNYGGFNHPFLVLDHYQNPESSEEGDLILEIVPITSFAGKSILETYSDPSYFKRMNSLPIEFNSGRNQDRPREMELLNRLQKPLLGLENSSTSRQLFVENNHIYRVSINQLHAYSPQNSDARRYVRLNSQGYNEVRSTFGMPIDGKFFNKRIETRSRTSRLAPKMGEELFLRGSEFNLVGSNQMGLVKDSVEKSMVFNPFACEFVPSSPVFENRRPSLRVSWV